MDDKVFQILGTSLIHLRVSSSNSSAWEFYIPSSQTID